MEQDTEAQAEARPQRGGRPLRRGELPRRPRTRQAAAPPEPEFDRVNIGGLMRCCLSTLAELYPNGPARIAYDGQTLQCQYSASPNHHMICRDGVWEWDRHYRGDYPLGPDVIRIEAEPEIEDLAPCA